MHTSIVFCKQIVYSEACGHDKSLKMSFQKVSIIPPSHTQIFLTSPYGSPKFTDPYDLAILLLILSDLRVFTSYYKLLTVYYGLLRCTYYLRKKFHDLLRVVTDNYEQLTGIFQVFFNVLLRVYYRMFSDIW